jgi:hypothetical protein
MTAVPCQERPESGMVASGGVAAVDTGRASCKRRLSSGAPAGACGRVHRPHVRGQHPTPLPLAALAPAAARGRTCGASACRGGVGVRRVGMTPPRRGRGERLRGWELAGWTAAHDHRIRDVVDKRRLTRPSERALRPACGARQVRSARTRRRTRVSPRPQARGRGTSAAGPLRHARDRPTASRGSG